MSWRKPKSPVNTLTGDELRRSLIELDMLQKELAEEIGFRPETISRYVRGELPIPRIVEAYIELRINGLSSQS